MHLSPNLFSFIVLIKLLNTFVAANTSALYFPSDNGEITQSYYNSEHRVQIPVDLEFIRGTTAYENFVNDIIASGISKLTVTLNKLLIREVKSTNVVFSPISITSALALVLLGSNGVTFREISQFLGLTSGIPDLDRKSQIIHEQFSRIINKLLSTSGFEIGVTINVATAAFVQSGYPIRPLYRSTAEELYHSSILNVDFSGNPSSAQAQINQWVGQNTNGKIKNILNDLPSSDTKVILASALYFNAEWEHHFFKGNTVRRPFYINGRNSESFHELDMMANGGDFPYYKDPQLGCEILGFPYKGNKSTMYVVVPFESSKEKLHEFELKLTEVDLQNLVGKTRPTGAVILFPRMKIESTFNMKTTLEYLGVRSLFNPQQANLALLSPGEAPYRVDQITPATLVAQGVDNYLITSSQGNQSTLFTKSEENLSRKITFSSRTPSQVPSIIESRATETLDNIRQKINQESTDNNYQNPGLYADQVIHKVYMDITETGTEAAAATSISLTRDGRRVTFRVDVPFFFFIRHEETKTLLFWGSVLLPTPNYRTFN